MAPSPNFDDGSSSVDAFGSSAGAASAKLMHQPVEFATRLIALAVDQGEAFGDEPHMRSGSFSRSRRQL